MTTVISSQFNPQIIRFPKDGVPALAANEWQVWNGEQDEGGIPDLEFLADLRSILSSR